MKRFPYVQYHQRVLASNPIAYWLLDEKLGTAAYDWVAENSVQNGAHTGVTLGQPGIGDGRTSPLYDGANDYTDVYSAAFNAAFSGGEGTFAVWAKVSAAAVWQDGLNHIINLFYVDGSNYIQTYKTTDNQTITWIYKAGAVTDQVSFIGAYSTGWTHLALTWSKTGEILRAYYNGVQVGTSTTLGVWAGAFNANFTLLGAGSKVPANVWNGTLAHPAVWGRVLSASEISDLANPYSTTPFVVAFGDSTTSGTGASTVANRWPNIVANTKAWDLYNGGVGATTLQNTVQNAVAVVGGAVTNNGRDTYTTRVTAWKPDYVLIMYGLNDLRLNDVAITVENFQNDLGEVVDALVASGVSASKIVLGSPPYMDPAQYGALAPWDGGSIPDHVAHVAAVAAVAAAKGTLYVDIYQAMLDGGDVALLSDGIHPNDAGYALIAATFLSVL